MKIETKKFGVVDVQDDQVIRFLQPIIGFPGLIKYVLIDMGRCVKWLQSIEDPSVVFPVVSPFEIKDDYNIELPTTEAGALSVRSADDVQLWSITVLSDSPGEIRANLRAPVVLNRRTGSAKQVVLPDNELPIRYHFVPRTVQSNKEVANVGAHA